MTHEDAKRIMKANKATEDKMNNMFKMAGLAYEVRSVEKLDDYGLFYFIYLVEPSGSRIRVNCGRTPIEALENLTNVKINESDDIPNDLTRKRIANKLKSILYNV